MNAENYSLVRKSDYVLLLYGENMQLVEPRIKELAAGDDDKELTTYCRAHGVQLFPMIAIGKRATLGENLHTRRLLAFFQKEGVRMGSEAITYADEHFGELLDNMLSRKNENK